MKLIMLGTGCAMVTECYNTCFIINDNDKLFMVDAGGGNTILHQLKSANCNYLDIHDIFITHKHIDHILGVVWMVRIISQKMASEEYLGDCNIYGHDEVIELIKDMSDKLLQKKQSRFIGDRIHLIEVTNGESKEIIGRKVTFFDIESTKAKQFGFSMEMGNGDKLTCCGDEPYSECERSYVQNSKWLLHESYCLYSQAEKFKPYDKHHSTVKDACELAEKLSIENLVLYHTEDKNILKRKELYLAEAKKYYSGNTFVPDDLETIDLG